LNKLLDFLKCGLASVNSKLDQILANQQRMEQKMTASLSDLDTAIANLNSTTATSLSSLAGQLAKDFTALVGKINSNGDYTNELSAVQTAITSLNTVASTLSATDASAQQVLVSPANPAIGAAASSAPVQAPFAPNAPDISTATTATGTTSDSE
jgi:uncharacterized protein YukE